MTHSEYRDFKSMWNFHLTDDHNGIVLKFDKLLDGRREKPKLA